MFLAPMYYPLQSPVPYSSRTQCLDLNIVNLRISVLEHLNQQDPLLVKWFFIRLKSTTFQRGSSPIYIHACGIYSRIENVLWRHWLLEVVEE